MDPNLLALAICSGLTLVGIMITALIWTHAKVKTVVWWFGFSLIPIAVYLLGLIPQTIGAYETLRLWYGTLTFTPIVWTGIALGGLGVFLMLVSRLIPAKPRKKKDAPALRPTGGLPAASTPRPAVAPPATQPMPAQSQATPADDMDEITQILKRRGIE